MCERRSATQNRPTVEKVVKTLPGLALCLALALVAVFVADVPWVKQNLRFSPLLIVILLGIVVASVAKLPKIFDEGVKLAQKPVLRWAVAGLGFKLSLPELVKIGGPSLLVVVVGTVACLAFGWWLGVRLGLNERLSILLGVGTAVCGASAVVAADTVVQADGEDAAVSLGVITLWGTVGIFLFPVLGKLMAMAPFPYGVWAGASLQEMAQVVAGAEGFGEPAVKVATVVKLARICLLAPIVFFLVWWLRKKWGKTGDAQVAAVPWFLVAFVVFAGLNSIAPQIGLSKSTVDLLLKIDVILLSVGMAGVGLKTGFRDLKKAGWKPVLIGLGSWAFLSVLTLVLIKLAGV